MVPYEILTQDWELSSFTDWIRTSTPNLKCWKLVVTSKIGPILVFHWIHPFASEAGSSRGSVYSRQTTDLRRISLAFLVTKYCPTSTTLINPASLQNLLNLSSGESRWTCWNYFCKRTLESSGSSRAGTSALTSLRTIDWPSNITGSPVLSGWPSYSSHIAATAP